MPELDTYNTLQRFASDNNDLANIQAYKFLKRRTERFVRWQAINIFGVSDIQKAVELYLGVSNPEATPQDLAAMSEEQRLSMYEQACAEFGIAVDPSAFKNDF